MFCYLVWLLKIIGISFVFVCVSFYFCGYVLFDLSLSLRLIHSFLYYKFGEHLNPKDKVQEAFIKVWENCKNITPEKAKSYLFTVGNNLMLNEVKHQKVVLKYQLEKPKSHTHENPEFLMEEQEYSQKLQKAIASLTEAQRVAFLLNRIEGKKHKEIAQLLDIIN